MTCGFFGGKGLADGPVNLADPPAALAQQARCRYEYLWEITDGVGNTSRLNERQADLQSVVIAHSARCRDGGLVECVDDWSALCSGYRTVVKHLRPSRIAALDRNQDDGAPADGELIVNWKPH